MTKWVAFAAGVIALAAISVSTEPARADVEGTTVRPAAITQDLSAQTRRRRPRILVYPQRQPSAWLYPRPGVYSYPGPGAIRQCADWYNVEYRPGSAVMTPQQRCWWVR